MGGRQNYFQRFHIKTFSWGYLLKLLRGYLLKLLRGCLLKQRLSFKTIFRGFILKLSAEVIYRNFWEVIYWSICWYYLSRLFAEVIYQNFLCDYQLKLADAIYWIYLQRLGIFIWGNLIRTEIVFTRLNHIHSCERVNSSWFIWDMLP